MILFTKKDIIEELTREIDDALDAIASDIKDVMDCVDDMDVDEIKSALQGVIDEIG